MLIRVRQAFSLPDGHGVGGTREFPHRGVIQLAAQDVQQAHRLPPQLVDVKF